MGKVFKPFQMIEISKDSKNWEKTAQENPTLEAIVDFYFVNNTPTKVQITTRTDFVCRNTTNDAFPLKSFKVFDTKPADTNGTNKERNNAKMKHAMVHANIWNSLTSDFQFELLENKVNYNRNNKYDGIEL